MRILSFAQIPKGIPQFQPSPFSALRSFIAPRAYFRVNEGGGPYTVEDLAAHAARCVLLAVYRRLVFLTLIFFPALVLLATHDSHIDGGSSLDLATLIMIEPHSALLLLYPVIALLIMCGPGIAYVAKLLGAFQVRVPRLRPKPQWAPLPRIAVVRFDIYRMVLFYAFILVYLVILLWAIHIWLAIPFRVTYGAEPSSRLLTGSEFLYFFSVTYTTVGYGDIVPVTFGGRLLVTAINAATLASTIYWFSALAGGARRRRVLGDLQVVYEWNRERLERYRGWFEGIAQVRGEVRCIGRMHWNMSLRLRSRKPCLLCGGTGVVEPGAALSAVVWPPFLSLDDISEAAGMSFWRLAGAIIGTDLIEEYGWIKLTLQTKAWKGLQDGLEKLAYGYEPLVDQGLTIRNAMEYKELAGYGD